MVSAHQPANVPAVARAPGKIVLSGAYAVLDGARAIVAAVNRYVIADAGRPATFITPEVEMALGSGVTAPFFDASALREDARKLGLGSSAAILAASLGALELARDPARTDAEIAEVVFPVALSAHRRAQGGGSGIDVAASVYGGVLLIEPRGTELKITSVELPPTISIRVYAAAEPASTPELIARVRALRACDSELYGQLMRGQAQASERTAQAILSGNAEEVLAGLAQQAEALAALGEAAKAPIVTPAIAKLIERARALGCVALPAGAGGGDVALFVSRAENLALPEVESLRPLELSLGAPGLSRVSLGE